MTSRSFVVGAALLAMCAFGTTAAQAGTVNVPAVGSIWLAGQPNGTTVFGIYGVSTAGPNSPTNLLHTTLINALVGIP